MLHFFVMVYAKFKNCAPSNKKKKKELCSWAVFTPMKTLKLNEIWYIITHFSVPSLYRYAELVFF